MLAVVSAITVQAGSSFRPTGAYTHAQCEALNRRRSVEAKQQDRVTQAIMCDTQPAACVTEMLYAHEFYWDGRKARASALGGSKCQLWRRDDDWPTVEPLLSSPSAARDACGSHHAAAGSPTMPNVASPP